MLSLMKLSLAVVLILMTFGCAEADGIGSETQPSCPSKHRGGGGDSQQSCDIVPEQDSVNLLQTHAGVSRHGSGKEHQGGTESEAVHDEASTWRKLKMRQWQTIAGGMFSKADGDGDGLLSSSEVDAVISRFQARLPVLQHVDWREYDNNADGALSKKEFVAAQNDIMAQTPDAMPKELHFGPEKHEKLSLEQDVETFLTTFDATTKRKNKGCSSADGRAQAGECHKAARVCKGSWTPGTGSKCPIQALLNHLNATDAASYNPILDSTYLTCIRSSRKWGLPNGCFDSNQHNPTACGLCVCQHPPCTNCDPKTMIGDRSTLPANTNIFVDTDPGEQCCDNNKVRRCCAPLGAWKCS